MVTQKETNPNSKKVEPKKPNNKDQKIKEMRDLEFKKRLQREKDIQTERTLDHIT